MADDTKQAMPLTVNSWGELWDFWTVKLAAVGSALGTIGVVWPTLPPDFIAHFPAWLGWWCQLCALLITLGIIPARAVKQQRAAESERPRTNVGPV